MAVRDLLFPGGWPTELWVPHPFALSAKGAGVSEGSPSYFAIYSGAPVRAFAVFHSHFVLRPNYLLQLVYFHVSMRHDWPIYLLTTAARKMFFSHSRINIKTQGL